MIFYKKFVHYSKNNVSSSSTSNDTINNTVNDTVNEFDVLYIYYNKIKLAQKVKNKLLEDIDFNNYSKRLCTLELITYYIF